VKKAGAMKIMPSNNGVYLHYAHIFYVLNASRFNTISIIIAVVAVVVDAQQREH
jgi:hypothetical protein